MIHENIDVLQTQTTLSVLCPSQVHVRLLWSRIRRKLLDDIYLLIEFKDNYPNIKQVPAIFIDDEYIGGYNELEKRLWKK